MTGPPAAGGDEDAPLPPPAAEERRLPVAYAAAFYAVPAAVAWAWLRWSSPGRSLELWAPPDWASDAAVGAAAGLAMAVLARLSVRIFGWARGMEEEFRDLVGDQRGWEIVILALVSGIGEEYFFRGALQEAFGIWAAAAVFGAVHWPLRRGLLPWPFVAAAAGAFLGWMRDWTGSLVAPAAAHAVVNMINLGCIARRRDRGGCAAAVK